MIIQNQIKTTLSQPKVVDHINSLLTNGENKNRTQLAENLCEHYNFYDPKGNKQIAGTVKALRTLEKKGHIILPEAKTTNSSKKAGFQRLKDSVEVPYPLPQSVSLVRELKLILVTNEQHIRTWNELMFREHPQGKRRIVGRQIRYLIQSEHGYLGGFGFSSSALHLQARDQWIGWDWDIRQQYLQYVVNMSRFLIRDGVTCKNLASKVLSMAVKALPNDFEQRYGYQPVLLETFIDTTNFKGTCYKAANWKLIGQTKGRGRQDADNACLESIKDVYIYSLTDKFRLTLGVAIDAGVEPVTSLEALPLMESLAKDNWAENEFGGALLGDKRLSKRLIEIGEEKVLNPGSSYNKATKGEKSKSKAYYRFIEQPDDSAVTPESILLPHREQTLRRMKAEKVVLCVQDGTDINFTSLTKCEGLGTIGKNQTGASSFGLHLHTSIALTTQGLPLGILKPQFEARQPKDEDDKRKPSEIPIEEKKTFSWIEGLRDSMEIKAQMPETEIINVLDREADFFELFDEQRTHSTDVDLLVRAKHNRKTQETTKLFDAVRDTKVQKTLTIDIPRLSARAKISKQKASEKRDARKASVSIRYKCAEISPPEEHKEKALMKLWVVHVKEYNVPKGVKALEWFLLTTRTIGSVEDALDCVTWYKLRWRIEDWHRVLKSGYSIEKLQHKTAERLKRAITINMIGAWRIMLLTLLGREAPELPPEVVFTDIEIKVLEAFSQKKRKIINPQQH